MSVIRLATSRAQWLNAVFALVSLLALTPPTFAQGSPAPATICATDLAQINDEDSLKIKIAMEGVKRRHPYWSDEHIQQKLDAERKRSPEYSDDLLLNSLETDEINLMVDSDPNLQGLSLEQYGFHRGDYQLRYTGIVVEEAKFVDGAQGNNQQWFLMTRSLPKTDGFISYYSKPGGQGIVRQSLVGRIKYIFGQFRLRSGMPLARIDQFEHEELELDPRRVQYFFYINKKTNDPVGAIRLYDSGMWPGSFGRGEGGDWMGGPVTPQEKILLEKEFPKLKLPERSMKVPYETDRPTIYELGRLTHEPNFDMTDALFRVTANYLSGKHGIGPGFVTPIWSGSIYAAATREKAFGYTDNEGRHVPGYVDKYGWKVPFTDDELKAMDFPPDAVILKYDVADFCERFGYSGKIPAKRNAH